MHAEYSSREVERTPRLASPFGTSFCTRCILQVTLVRRHLLTLEWVTEYNYPHIGPFSCGKTRQMLRVPDIGSCFKSPFDTPSRNSSVSTRSHSSTPNTQRPYNTRLEYPWLVFLRTGARTSFAYFGRFDHHHNDHKLLVILMQ